MFRGVFASRASEGQGGLSTQGLRIGGCVIPRGARCRRAASVRARAVVSEGARHGTRVFRAPAGCPSGDPPGGPDPLQLPGGHGGGTGVAQGQDISRGEVERLDRYRVDRQVDRREARTGAVTPLDRMLVRLALARLGDPGRAVPVAHLGPVSRHGQESPRAPKAFCACVAQTAPMRSSSPFPASGDREAAKKTTRPISLRISVIRGPVRTIARDATDNRGLTSSGKAEAPCGRYAE